LGYKNYPLSYKNQPYRVYNVGQSNIPPIRGYNFLSNWLHIGTTLSGRTFYPLLRVCNLPLFTVADDVTIESTVDDNDMVVAVVISRTQMNNSVQLHQRKRNITATRNYTDHFETVNACGLQS